MNPLVAFSDVVASRGSGSSGLPQSEWLEEGAFPVIGQGAKYIEGWSDRADLAIYPDPAFVLYGGHTRRAKLVEEPFVPGPNVKILQPSPELDAAYLYRFLEQLHIESRGYADHFPEVKRSKIPLPPLAEQKRIAAILDAADALRAKRRQCLAQLDTLIQATFLDMFGDPVANPKGWPKQPMGNLMRIRRGGSPRPIKDYLGGTINWIKIGDATISDNDLYITSCEDQILETGLSKTVLLEAGSLVFANSGVSLGFARILGIRGAIHDGWLSFDGYDSDVLDTIFVLKALNGITEHFRRIAPSGTQPNLTTSIMKSFQLIVPPIRIQRRFADVVRPLESLKNSTRAHHAQLDQLFVALQDRAFSGEL